MKTNYRIKNANGTILNSGTDKPSWFNIDDARKIVNRNIGQKIFDAVFFYGFEENAPEVF